MKNDGFLLKHSSYILKNDALLLNIDDSLQDENDNAEEPHGGVETHVGRQVVGWCLSNVLGSGAPSGGPGRRWLELESNQAEECLRQLITTSDDEEVSLTDTTTSNLNLNSY